FFFQAEDGIRDLIVTGVQTCALPISQCRSLRLRMDTRWLGARSELIVTALAVDIVLVSEVNRNSVEQLNHVIVESPFARLAAKRSEERRVGKECRYRMRTDHEKKKNK